MELCINAWYCPCCFTQVRGRPAYEAHVQHCWLNRPQTSEEQMRVWTEHHWALYDEGVESSRDVRLDDGATVAAAAFGEAAAAARGADVAADGAEARSIGPPCPSKYKKQTLKLPEPAGPPCPSRYKKKTLKLPEPAGPPCKKAAVGPGPAAGAAAGGAADPWVLRAVAPPRKKPTLVDLTPAGEAAAAAEAAAETAEAGASDTLVPAVREHFRSYIDRVNAEQRAIMQAAVDADPNMTYCIYEPLPHYQEAQPPSEVITKKGDGKPGPAAKK